MTLDRLRRTWETLGREDPLWAVRSDPSKRHKQWDVEEFFRSGQDEIDRLFRHLERRGLSVHRGRCLDFGCGVGRLSRALCSYFDSVDGVDIAQSMIEQAESYNVHGTRCRFHVNPKDNLNLFADKTFDFVCSNVVLQHMEADLAERYIAEFIRVLVPGGLAVFQAPYEFRDPTRLTTHKAEIDIESVPALEARTGAVVGVRIRNVSTDIWKASAPIHVGNHWLGRDGSTWVWDDGRAQLPDDMHPGDERSVELRVTAPKAPGQYILEVDLVEEGVDWFGLRNSTTARTDVEVVRRPLWRRVAQRLGRTRRKDTTRATDSPTNSEMHLISKERVIAAATSAGGEVVDIEEDQFIPDPGWKSYMYYVRRT